MLAQVETIELVASYLAKQKCPYVLDPVMVATSGDRLIEVDAIQALKTKLLPCYHHYTESTGSRSSSR